MIIIARNPNTQIATIAKYHKWYFGVADDGYEMNDDGEVYAGSRVESIGELPENVFEQAQKTIDQNHYQNHKPWYFKKGNKLAVGASGNTSPRKNVVTDRVLEVLEQKHYAIKGTGQKVRGIDLYAEKLVDDLIEKRNPLLVKEYNERLEGKVTQGVKLSGGLTHGTLSDADMERLKEVFPESVQVYDEPTV